MITLDSIANEMIKRLGYDFRTIKDRKRQNIYIRAIFFKLAKELTLISLHEIGQYINNKTHGTVINAIKTFDNDVKPYEPNLYSLYKSIKFNLTIPSNKEVVDVDLLTYGIKTN